MQLTQTVSMAFKAISGNKVRAFLTMLGVIIGVMSVIVLIAIGQGTTASVTESISSMGTNLLTVSIQTRRVGMGMPGGFGGFGGGSSSKGTVILKLDDILALEDDDSIQYVSPTTSGSLTVKAGSTNTSATVMGVLPAYAKIVNQGVQSGRYIIDADVDNRSAVCVIGPDLAEDLFGNTNVVGNTLHIDGRKFKIVGVLESKGTSMGGSSDDSLILPFTLAQRMLDLTTISSIYISAVDSASVDAAQEVVENFLYKKYQNDSTYSVMNQTQMLETANETASTLSLMLGGIAGISMLVGRHRHHEHHARVGDGTHAGNRHSQSHRREAQEHPAAISDRVHRHFRHGRPDRLGIWLPADAGAGGRAWHDTDDERGRCGTGDWILDGGRRDFRPVSGQQGQQAQAD